MKDRTNNTEDSSVTLSELKEKLTAEKNKNSITTALLEGGTLIIWAVDPQYQLISFNQNYFNYFLHDNPNLKVGHFKKGYEDSSEIEFTTSNLFWKEKYEYALNGNSHNFEILINFDGSDQWKEVFLNPVYDTRGEITGVSGLAYDITEKMQSRIALIKSEEKFRNIFESFQDLYFRCDFSGTITMLSPSVKDIMGYAEEDLLNQNITNFYLYNIQTKYLIRKLAKEKRVRNFEAGIVHRSGKIIPCLCNVRVIQDETGRFKHVEGVARDITELKQANEELQRSKELAERSLKIKERFLANMSHEIRTPLNGIMGMLHLLDDTKLDGKQKQHVRALKSSSDILLSILNDLLDLSKIEAGKMELKNSVINTRSIFKKLLLLYRQNAIENDTSLVFNLSTEVPRYIKTDEIKLIQVFSNLISNAIKFSLSGGKVVIGLEKEKGKKNGNVILRGYVKDDGVGISKQDYKKLFTSFTQLDSSSSKSYKGTGLGLYLSKKIVKLFNGRIDVQSQPGKGSEFWFTFETKKVNEGFPKNQKEELIVELTNSPAVLVVDDNRVNMELASEILRNAGCRVTTASSGKESILKSRGKCYDLILMDIQMPDMDGVEACRKIRLLCKTSTPPIIAMTAYSMSGDKQKFIDLGMDDYLAKPINPALLIKKVSKWTSNLKTKSIKNSTKEEKESKHLTINKKTLNLLEKYAGHDTVMEAVNEYKKECERQIRECSENFDEENFDEVLNILHTLKGNASTLGIERMAFQAKKMEEAIQINEYSSFKGDLVLLDNLYHEFVKEAKVI